MPSSPSRGVDPDAPDSTPETNAGQVLEAYSFPFPTQCELMASGLNDVYRVKNGVDRYVLKLYRAGWRTNADVLWEVEALRHLDHRDVPIARPIAGRDGYFVRELVMPE